MPAKMIFKKEMYEIPHGLTIQSALERIEVSPESVIPTRKGVLIPEDEIIKDGEVIKLVAVISGG